LLSNWIGYSNVPGIDAIATDEDTDPGSGTLFENMYGPINSIASTGGFYLDESAAGQADFNNWLGADIYKSGRPMITALMTEDPNYPGGDLWLHGWDYSQIDYKHIIELYGFDFTSGDNVYYVETSGTVAGTDATGLNEMGDNKFWDLVWLNDGQIW